jgi:predicted transcriptional regulator
LLTDARPLPTLHRRGPVSYTRRMNYPDPKRLVIVRAVLAARQVGMSHFGNSMDRLAVLLAVGLGRLENNPMDVSSIAAMVGISRQGVLRQLNALEKLGWITMTKQGRRSIALATYETARGQPNAMAYFRKMETIISKAAHDMSDLDT